MYVAKFVYADSCPLNGAKPVESYIKHGSMLELKDWAIRNNMRLGAPRMYSPNFSVEHLDGTQLSETEVTELQTTASNDQYLSRLDVLERQFSF